MVRLTLILSAVYLSLVGVGLMFFPLQFGIGAVPEDASPQLIALLRLLGGPFLGIAMLNWLSRDSTPSELKPVVLANLVGFGAVAANDVLSVSLGEAREAARYFMLVHLAFAIAFLAAVRKTRSAR